MTKPLPIKEGDTVEVLPGCTFSSLVYSKGIARKASGSMASVVEFPTEKRSKDFDTMEVFQSKFWCIPWRYLKVLESAYDDRLGQMEHEIQDLEESLMFTRSCLSISEELRDQQSDLIDKLVGEIDLLKVKVYRLSSGNN